jgi:hypothetical protein
MFLPCFLSCFSSGVRVSTGTVAEAFCQQKNTLVSKRVNIMRLKYTSLVFFFLDLRFEGRLRFRFCGTGGTSLSDGGALSDSDSDSELVGLSEAGSGSGKASNQSSNVGGQNLS